MRITPKSGLAKVLVGAPLVVLFLLSVFWIGKVCLAELVAEKPAVQNLQLALKLDPSNADYHRGLGRLFQYDLDNIDPAKAIDQLRQAVALSPKDAHAWLDLGLAQELQGDTTEAEASLRRADFLAPNITFFQWSIANFFLLHGNVDEAFRHFKAVLAGTQDHNQAIFSTAWKASGDGDKILAEVIPNYATQNVNYLYYLVTTNRMEDAQKLWARLVASPEAFNAGSVGFYIEALIGAHRPDAAYQAWTELHQKGLIPATAEETEKNRIINGDFEEGWLGFGFDWRIVPVDGVYVNTDQTTYHSPGHSLMIQFLGKQNVDCSQAFQFVKVSPGHSYRLSWAMKTEEITTDSGPRLEVHDFYDYRLLDKYSDSVAGTTGWTSSILDFTASPKTDLIVVSIRRLPSQKLDNLISGKVWVDDVSLMPIEREAAQARK